jgi:hypothetical protein
MDPSAFEQQAPGESNVVLLKALATARMSGVACEGVSRVSDRPSEAIVEAAIACGADLIVMASRGVRGLASWLHSSQTERVLKRSPVALLVTRVAANEPLSTSERALGIIHDEHRSIAVVMQSLRRIGSTVGAFSVQDLQQGALLLNYLCEFPQRLHHPKEEMCLHRAVRERAPNCSTNWSRSTSASAS